VDYNLNDLSSPNKYNSSNVAPYNDNNSEDSSVALAPSTDDNPLTNNVAVSTPTVLLYLKDGTMVAATDYWLSGEQLHYVVDYAGESSISLDQLDWQRTVDENSKRGVRFTLKDRPDTISSPAPASGTSAAPALAPASPEASPAPASSAPPVNGEVSPT